MNKENTVVSHHPMMVVLEVGIAQQGSNTKCPYRPEASEPSMFTHVQGQLCPRWVNWFMTKFGLSQQMATNIGTALYDHLVGEPRRTIDPLAPEPSAMLQNVGLVSMAFVMHYKHLHDVSFTEAFSIGHDLVALQSGETGFAYSSQEELTQTPVPFSRLA